jgi:large repetitive protein
VEFRYPGIGITNGAPVFQTTPVITHTNSTTGVLTGTFKASDPNGDKLSFFGLGLLGTIDVDDTPAEDGVTYTFTYTPYNAHAAAGLNLTDLVTITASDSGLLTDVKTFSVSLANDVNQNPVATYQNTGGSSLLGTVTGQIVVTDDDSVHSYTPAIITTSKGGVLVSLLTGDYVYTASLAAREAASATGASDADKIDTFTVTVSDMHGGTTDVLVTVTIPTINIAPIGGAPSNTLGDSNGVVRGHITLVINTDGDPLSYSIKGAGGATTVKTGGGGILHLNADGSYVYVPRVNKDPILGLDAPYGDSFTIVVSDGRGGTSDVLVPLGVLGATGPLKNVGVTKTDNGNGTVTVGVTLGAGNAGLLNFGVGAGPSKGNVTENADGTFTYTTSVTTHTDASDEFTIIGTIDGLSVTVATVEVEPTLPNNPPTGGIGTTTGTNTTFIDRGIVLGTPVTPATQNTSGKFNATDPDGDSVTFAGGIYESTKGGLVTVLANGGFNYTRTTYNDSHHKAAAVNATDADKFDTVTINVSDGWGGTTAVTFRIALATSNDDPSTSVSVGSADGLGVVRGSVKGSDSDDDPVTYSLINAGNPAGATSTSTYTTKGGVVQLKSDGTFIYIPTSSATGTDSFKVTVSDGHGGTVTATVNVPIVGASSTKTASPTDKENGTLNISAGNLGLLSYSKGSDGAKGKVVVNSDGSYTYTRNAGQGHSTTPNDSFTIVGTDINGKTVTLKVNVAPAIANAAPVGGSVTLTSSTLKDQAVLWNRQSTSGSIAASDGDNDAVTFTAVTDLDTNNGGTVTVNANGTFTYTIDKLKTSNYFHDAAKVNASGTTIADWFNVTINDAFGGSTVYKVNVAIYAQNDNPTISGGVRLFNTWTSVFASGTDGDSVTTAVTKQPQKGSASYNSGLSTLTVSGASGGNTVELTVTETGYWKVVDGVAQVGTLASTTRTFTV